MKLVFVHGRAQEGKNPDDLRKLWINTFKIGLSKSGLDLPIAEDEIYLPYYGDKLDELVSAFNKPIEEVVQKGTQSSNKDAKFFHDFLLEVSKNAAITNSDIEMEAEGEIIEKGPLNWAWVQAILRAIDKKGSWGELSLKKFTYDVFMYLTQTNIKNHINNIISTSIGNEPSIVVAHSLGSIVSYNVLRDDPSLNVGRFITVGSPLGLRSVKKYLKTPIQMPASVQNGWFNAYDDRDVVALNALDHSYFNINPRITNKSDVNNQTSNRHGIEGYLNDADIAKEIYEALTAS